MSNLFAGSCEISKKLRILRDPKALSSMPHPWVRRLFVIFTSDEVRIWFVPGARSLIGVQDTKLFPMRGQAILVRAPQLHECLIDTGSMSTVKHYAHDLF